MKTESVVPTALPSREPQGTPRSTRSTKMGHRVAPYAFLAPFVLLYLLVLVGPLLYALFTSLFTTRLAGGITFSGLANYARVLQSSDFWSGLERVLVFGVIQVPIMLGLALLFALLFDMDLVPMAKVYRLVYFLPFAVPGVVAAILWGFMLEPQYGALAQLIRISGMGVPNLLDSSSILKVIGVIVTWQATGFNTVIIYTALRGVPRELTEAAILDGATLGVVMLRIKVPLVGKALALSAFLAVIGTLQLFSEPYILSSYTPAINSHYTPNMYIYSTAFAGEEYNYAAAASFMLALITIVGVLVVMGFRTWVEHRGGSREG